MGEGWSSGTAVVTGASSGIGEQYARALADRGMHVVLVARRRERLARLASELGVAEIVVADLATDEGIDDVAGRVVREDVTLLVNNAGLAGYAPFTEVDPAVVAQVVKLNVLAPTLLARAAAGAMAGRGSGAIVNVASLLAFSGALPPDPLPPRATYAGTKAHVVAFTRTLAHELDGTGVGVQVVCPGFTQTEFHSVSGTAPAESADPPSDRAMSAEDVVRASLRALGSGEVVCVPGLEDPSALDALADAEALLRAGSQPKLAARYAG
ncbi:MAG TPA: SDR family NAD(P)-dependent oxidoreductase [Solirubrobacteraceae bacterium]|nr:SDR family NAD(P)-dependent oxidoreductase [Solirubrobacteraceae bacterium]